MSSCRRGGSCVRSCIAGRRDLVDVVAEVPGLLVTTSFLWKLLVGDPKVLSQSE